MTGIYQMMLLAVVAHCIQKLVHVVHHVPSGNREVGISPIENRPNPEPVHSNAGEATSAGSPSARGCGGSQLQVLRSERQKVQVRQRMGTRSGTGKASTGVFQDMPLSLSSTTAIDTQALHRPRSHKPIRILVELSLAPAAAEVVPLSGVFRRGARMAWFELNSADRIRLNCGYLRGHLQAFPWWAIYDLLHERGHSAARNLR
jgi:hypothetical protein